MHLHILIYTNYLLLLVFTFTALYLLLFSIAGKFYKNKIITKTPFRRKYAVLIPAYQEDEIIEEVLDEALKQNYPSELFDIILIADSFDYSTIKRIKNKPIKLIKVKFKESTKTKAIKAALNQLDEADYDLALILDADNVMEKNFLEKLNFYFNVGCKVVQAHRIAKNLDTSFSILDGASEEINNSIFRDGHRSLGLSSALIGSGMAFEFNLLKELLTDAKAVSGFDKELEFKLLRRNIEIEYARQVYVYDEKIQKANAFANQRKRWIIAQIEHLFRNIAPGILSFVRYGNIDYLNKVAQMCLVPRSLLIGFIPIWAIINLILYLYTKETYWLNLHYTWVTIFALTSVSFLIAMPRYLYSRSTLLAIIKIPLAFVSLSHTLLNINRVRKHFIHTKHSVKQSRRKEKTIKSEVSA